MTDRTKAMDALIAGDADLYDALDGLMAHMPDYADTLWQNASEALEKASARINGDKDRENPVERPQLEYDHTLEGTANFERALSYVRSLEADADFSNSQYAFFMAERGDHLNMLVELAHQYLSDLRYPPAPDSKERRIERIEAVLKQVQP